MATFKVFMGSRPQVQGKSTATYFAPPRMPVAVYFNKSEV